MNLPPGRLVEQPAWLLSSRVALSFSARLPCTPGPPCSFGPVRLFHAFRSVPFAVPPFFRALPVAALFAAVFTASLLAAPLACGQDAPAGDTTRAARADSLAPPVARPGDTLRVRLPEALARSLARSPEVDRREAELAHAQARHRQAKASRYLPELSLSTVHSVAPGLDRSQVPEGVGDDELYLAPEVENDWTPGALRPFNGVTLEFGQPVWTWGELDGSISAARASENVESARIEAKELEVAFRTAELYYDVLLARQLSRLTGEARSRLRQAREEVKTRLQEGDSTVSRADLFQLRRQQQEFRRRVVNLKQRRLTAASGLGRQLFAPPGTAVLPATSFLEPVGFEVRPLSHYVDVALENRPQIQQAEAGVEARTALVEVERSNYYPKLFIGGRFGQRYAYGRPNQESAYIGENFVGSTTEAAFSIRQDLSFLTTRANVEQAEAELAEVRAQRRAARQLVPFEVEEAWRSLVSAKGALQARNQAFGISQEWERFEQTQYDLGFGSTDNLTSALQARLQSQIAYYEAVRDYNVAVMKLLRVTGLLNEPQQVGTLVERTTPGAPSGE
jgi:outer membrane protein TolC